MLCSPHAERKGFNMIAVYSDDDFSSETRNIRFTFENGVEVSIGVSSMHYCTPRTNQGHSPEREAVEVAVILPHGGWGTREVIKNVLGYDPGDDVAPNLTADQVAWVIDHARRMRVNQNERGS